MAERRISSLLVGDSLQDSDALGIVTERDVLRALAREGGGGVRPAGRGGRQPAAADGAGGRADLPAIGRMANRNVRHLAALDAQDAVSGILTTRDLLKLRASSAIALGDDIDSAVTVPELARAFAKLPAMARALVAESVPARGVAAVIAREIGALTRRAAQMAEEQMAEAGQGPAPCAYAVLVLGSAAGAKAFSRWTRTTRSSSPRASRTPGGPLVRGAWPGA